jgi:Primase C terminal 2 (PriCT-2)/RepB DNA-primase from phage plasmid
MNAPTASLMGDPISIRPRPSGTQSGPKHTNLDIEQQRRFIRLLNPKSGGFTLQTFADNKSVRDPSLTRVIQSPTHGGLLQLHAHGAGIYVTVNETDGKGRKSENITRIRAVWQEDDDGFDGAFPLHPSMVVETSPGHFHRYWLVADDWPADERGRADFAAVMERMVENYGSDKNAKDISRVLRFPGFLHRKGETPHLVRIVEASARRYSRAEIIAAFPPVERPKKDKAQHRERPLQDGDERRIADALTHTNADDRDLWVQCGMAIKDHLGDAGRQLWDDWSQQSDKYNERDQDRTWKSALRFRICIASVPSTLSLREIADRETRQRSDSSRTDHLSKARAARS